MPAGTTKLSDVIIPELFDPYVSNRTMELSELVQCGIISHSSEYDTLASQAAPTVQMPFWEDLNGESEPIIEDVALTANKITSNKDVAAIFRRAMMWSATDLSAALAGSDPMAEIANKVASFWARDDQKELLAILQGVFASTSMAGHILDISTKSGVKANWDVKAFLDAQQLLGDAQSQLTAVAMHSATWTYLKKLDLIDEVKPSADLSFYTYQGKRIIIDDGCPYDTTDKVFTTYLFGQGAIAKGIGNPVGFVATEVDRDKKMGSGVDYLINRKTSILHPRGIKFTNANVANVEGPTRAEFKDGTNWERVYDPKQIRIVAFKHKIGE